MGVILRITGPGPDRIVALNASGGEITLGRDANADIVLADAPRFISRRHLTLRQVDNQVEVRVVSSVNGVSTLGAVVPPGELLLLSKGEFFDIGPFKVTVEDSDDAFAEHDDADAPPSQPSIATAPESAPAFDHSWPAFARGLQLPPDFAVDERSAEHAGETIRQLLAGLGGLLIARSRIDRRRGETGTVPGEQLNPLKCEDLSVSDLVQYLFSAGPEAGYMAPARAVHMAIAQLEVHERATLSGARAAVAGAFREFEPDRFRSLPNSQPQGVTFGRLPWAADARCWRAFEAYYAAQKEIFADWLDQVFERHFTSTYQSESERLKRLQGQEPFG